jgi:hypothetical protein
MGASKGQIGEYATITSIFRSRAYQLKGCITGTTVMLFLIEVTVQELKKGILFHNSGKYVDLGFFTTALILNDTIINKQALYGRIV